MPRLCRSSGKETPAAWTSTSTPSPGVSMCEASGSGSSTSCSALSGPVSWVIWIALIGGIMSERPAAGLALLTRALRRPSMWGAAGIRRAGLNAKRSHVSISNPACSMPARVSRARLQPPAMCGQSVASASSCTRASRALCERTCS